MSIPFTVHTSFAVLALTMACGGCSSEATPGARESTVRGTAALATFAVAPAAIAARDETGTVVRAAVDAEGRFALPIGKGHTYRLGLLGARGAAIPIVFPRVSGTLDATFALQTNGASLDLGIVRDYAGAPPGGFHVLTAKVSAPAAAGDCVDCVTDDQQVICEGSDPPGSVSTAMAGGDAAEQADASAEMAVGDQNLPEQVTGCDATSDGDNQNLQQEGEH